MQAHEYLKDSRVQGYFSAFGLEASDVEMLFALLDTDNSGELDVGEFVDGCLRLKGDARSIDIHSIMHDLKHLDGRVEALCKAVHKIGTFPR